MQILNVGPWELFLVLLIVLIVLGPDNMVKTGRTLGLWVYKFIRSPMWAQIVDTSREIRNIPTKLVREAGLEESLKEIKDETKSIGGSLNADLKEAADDVNAAARATSGGLAFATANQIRNEKNGPATGSESESSAQEEHEDLPESPPMELDDEEIEFDPADEQYPTDTPVDKVIPEEGAKPAPAIIEVGDSDEIREEMVEEGTEDLLEKPEAEEDIDNPQKEDVPPPAIIDVDEGASFGDTFIEPFEESTLVEEQDEDAFPDEPLEERAVEQWREKVEGEQKHEDERVEDQAVHPADE